MQSIAFSVPKNNGSNPSLVASCTYPTDARILAAMISTLRIGLLLVPVLCAFLATAQAPETLRFYGVKEGLSSPIATCLAEDSTGFIWVGTREGLNRFDGVQFTVYQTDTATGLPSDNVAALLHLGNDRLLVGLVNSGLALYDPLTDGFTCFDTLYNAEGVPFTLPRSFFRESDSTVVVSYLGTSRHAGGLVRAHLQHRTQEVITTALGNVERFVRNPSNGEVWAVGDGVFKSTSNQLREWESYSSPFVSAVTVPYFSDIVPGEDTVVIASRGDGIHLYSRQEGRFIRNDLWATEGRKISQNRVNRLLPADDGNLWVATADRGLAHWRKSDGRFTFAPVDHSRQHHMEDLDYFDVFQDSYGNIWGASGGGLVSWSNREEGLVYKRVDSPDFPPFTSYYVRVVHQGKHLLAFTARHAVGFVLDASTMEVVDTFPIDWERDGHRYYLDSDHVFTADDGTVYCLGLNHIHRKQTSDRSFTPWVDLHDLVLSRSNELQCMTLDSLGQLWVGTNDNRILRLSTAGEVNGSWWLVGDTIARLSQNGDAGTLNARNVVMSMASDGRGGVLASSYRGVFHVSDRGVRNVKELCEGCDRLNEHNFFNMKGSGGRIALPSRGSGLFVYDFNESQLRQYDRSSGLLSVRVDDVAFASDGGIWAVGPNGLFSIHESSAPLVQHFLGDPGLPYDNLSWHRITSATDGKLYIGMANGIARIHPAKLQAQQVPRRLVFNEIRSKEKHSTRHDATVHVKFGDPLEVRIAALGFDRPEGYRYAWRYAGSEHWTEIAEPRVVFSSLGEGDFGLEFRAGNRQGEWSDAILRLQVDVDTPFIRSSAFRWVLAAAFVVLVFALFQISVRRNRERERRAQEFSRRITELELQALRAQMNPHFLFNTLNSIKFFIIRNEPEAAADYLTKFSRLIRLILSNSKSERIPLSTELEALSLYVELERLRFGKQFEFVLQVDDTIEAEYIQLPPLIIQPYVENAIWHGLMHSKAEGRLELSIALDGETLVVHVDDNGIGREAASVIRSKTATKEKSMGMDITRNRLRVSSFGRAGRVEVYDYNPDRDGRTGTLVTLYIPVEL